MTTIAVVALLLLVGAAAAVTADEGGQKITICHKPDQQARTMQVSRASWSGHEAHGDHRGPCGSTAGAATHHAGSSGSAAREARPAHVGVTVDAVGGLEGKAFFTVNVTADREDALDVVMSARLRGDGQWRVRSADADCSIESETLTCDIGRLEDGALATIRLRFDAGPEVCERASVHAFVDAANDDGADDNDARTHTRVGACAVGDRPPV